MRVCSTYSVRSSERCKAFEDTVVLYRQAVDFFIDVMRDRPEAVAECKSVIEATHILEKLTILTPKRPVVLYDFSARFYKFPSYLRRSAIAEAFGKYSSWASNWRRWEENGKVGKAPGKIYHCDLNGSYNIGARYFIRELLKSVPETERLRLEAKVPSVSRRSTCVLSDLISLGAAMAA